MESLRDRPKRKKTESVEEVGGNAKTRESCEREKCRESRRKEEAEASKGIDRHPLVSRVEEPHAEGLREY